MTTEKELGQALKGNQEYIEIEFDLAKKVLRIKALGNVAWGACITCIAVAAIMAVVTISSGGTATPVTGPTAALVLSTAAVNMGMPAAISATGIAIAGGGVAALGKLRKYRVEKISDSHIILHRH